MNLECLTNTTIEKEFTEENLDILSVENLVRVLVVGVDDVYQEHN